MRKDLSGLIATLAKSVTGISTTQPLESRDELMAKSFSEFEATLLERLDPVLPPDEEPLAKGLNHIATFANALRSAGNTVNALQTGKPSWMVSSDGGDADEKLPDEISDMLTDWINVGVDCLRSMVNSTAELPNESELRRLERSGNLAKIATFEGDELLVKTELPEDYHEFLTDPVEMLANMALHGQVFTERARAIAEDLQKQDALPDEIVQSFPELFEPPMAKARDENVGTGGDPDAAPDPGTDPNGPDDGTGDDAPQNPIELITRLASIIVVVAGSVLQGQGGGAPDDTDVDTGTDDGTNAPPVGNPTSRLPPQLRRQAPSFDVPLKKILAGEVEVDPELADALEELDKLRKIAAAAKPAQPDAELRKQLDGANTELAKLKEMVERLQKQPAPAKGTVMVVEKRDDTPGPLPQSGPVDLNKIAAEVERLRDVDPDGAARALLKATHAGGGRPFVSFED